MGKKSFRDFGTSPLLQMAALIAVIPATFGFAYLLFNTETGWVRRLRILPARMREEKTARSRPRPGPPAQKPPPPPTDDVEKAAAPIDGLAVLQEIAIETEQLHRATAYLFNVEQARAEAMLGAGGDEAWEASVDLQYANTLSTATSRIERHRARIRTLRDSYSADNFHPDQLDSLINRWTRYYELYRNQIDELTRERDKKLERVGGDVARQHRIMTLYNDQIVGVEEYRDAARHVIDELNALYPPGDTVAPDN